MTSIFDQIVSSIDFHCSTNRAEREKKRNMKERQANKKKEKVGNFVK